MLNKNELSIKKILESYYEKEMSNDSVKKFSKGLIKIENKLKKQKEILNK